MVVFVVFVNSDDVDFKINSRAIHTCFYIYPIISMIQYNKYQRNTADILQLYHALFNYFFYHDSIEIIPLT